MRIYYKKILASNALHISAAIAVICALVPLMQVKYAEAQTQTRLAPCQRDNLHDVVTQQIVEKYLTMGYPHCALLFEQTTPEGDTADGGRYLGFAGGVIYYYPDIGARAIWGLKADLYASLGYERGPLGRLTTDVGDTADGEEWIGFQNGVIYDYRTEGTFAIYGPMADKYASMGYERSPLGHLTTSEGDTADGGRYIGFQKGVIYYYSDIGTHAIYGAMADKYASMGYERSPLGRLTTDEGDTADGGRYIGFAGGVIYYYSNIGTHAIYGAIVDRYASMGYERSFLGRLISDPISTADAGSKIIFTGGAIYSHPDGGTHEVHGLIFEHYKRMGMDQSYLGVPISDEMDTPKGKGRVSKFTGGLIVFYPGYGTSATSSFIVPPPPTPITHPPVVTQPPVVTKPKAVLNLNGQTLVGSGFSPNSTYDLQLVSIGVIGVVGYREQHFPGKTKSNGEISFVLWPPLLFPSSGLPCYTAAQIGGLVGEHVGVTVTDSAGNHAYIDYWCNS